MEVTYNQKITILQDQIQRLQAQQEKVVKTDTPVQANQGLVAVAEKSNGQLQRAEAWVSELTSQVSRLSHDLETQQEHHPASSNLTELQAKVARARLQLDQACAWKTELQRLGSASEGKRQRYSDNEIIKNLREQLELQRKQIRGLEEQNVNRESLMSDHAGLTELVRISNSPI